VALPPVGAMRYYNSDVHLVDVYGVLGFDRRYPDLGFAFSAYNTRTHPPGVIVLLSVLYRAWGSEPWWRLATVLAVLSMLAAVCAWAMGRVLGGDRAGRIAAALLVAAPGPLLLAYTAMDAIFATAMTAGMALAMVAIRRRSAAWAAGAGAVLAGTTYLTYATVFVVLAVTLAVLVQVRRPLPVLRMLGAAGAAGLLTLGLLRVGLDYDLLASYHAVPSASRPYDPYWIAGSPAAWLVFAGLPLAALGITGLFRRYPPARRPVLGAILIGLMLVWAALPGSVTHLRPGEVERTWAFLYPVLAASAGPLVERWTRDRGWVAGAMVGTLVLLSVFQALVIQNFWDTFY
jgi:asparagine N-glycosylation enzyme membrane subunit Stt3